MGKIRRFINYDEPRHVNDKNIVEIFKTDAAGSLINHCYGDEKLGRAFGEFRIREPLLSFTDKKILYVWMNTLSLVSPRVVLLLHSK